MNCYVLCVYFGGGSDQNSPPQKFKRLRLTTTIRTSLLISKHLLIFVLYFRSLLGLSRTFFASSEIAFFFALKLVMMMLPEKSFFACPHSHLPKHLYNTCPSNVAAEMHVKEDHDAEIQRYMLTDHSFCTSKVCDDERTSTTSALSGRSNSVVNFV